LEGRKKVGTGTYTPGGGGLEADEMWEFIAKSKFSMQKRIYMQNNCEAASRYSPVKDSVFGVNSPGCEVARLISRKSDKTRTEKHCIACLCPALHCEGLRL